MYIRCDNCQIQFERSTGRYNEAIKFGWRQFCSTKCQSVAKGQTKACLCSNPTCKKSFARKLSQAKLSKLLFCSHLCSAQYYGKISKKDHAHTCEMIGCENIVTSDYLGKRFCSNECLKLFQKVSKYSMDSIVKIIQDLYYKHERIPVKYELQYLYEPARKLFGTWNKAIEAAGFDPNPVMFAKHYMAKDGHNCDSLAEKIVDDYLFARHVEHQIHVPYPFNNGMKCDFKIKDTWVEIFGLSDQHHRYDELKQEKMRLIKENGLNFIQLNLREVYDGKMDQIFYERI